MEVKNCVVIGGVKLKKNPLFGRCDNRKVCYFAASVAGGDRITFLAATDGRYGFTPVVLGCSAVNLSRTGVFFRRPETGGALFCNLSRGFYGADCRVSVHLSGYSNKCLTGWPCGMYNTRLNVLYLAGMVPRYGSLQSRELPG